MMNMALRLIRPVTFATMVIPARKMAVVDYTLGLQFELTVALKERGAWFHDNIRLRSHRLTNAMGKAQ